MEDDEYGFFAPPPTEAAPIPSPDADEESRAMSPREAATETGGAAPSEQPPESELEKFAAFLAFCGALAVGLGVLTWLIQYQDDSYAEVGLKLIGWGALAFVVGSVLFMITASTPKGQQRTAAAEAARRLENETWAAQLDSWRYDPQPAHRKNSWPPVEFRTYDVMMGSTMQGQPVPLWSKVHLQLAPPDMPTLAARIAPFEPGAAIDVPVSDVIRLQARSRSGAWFGLGASGAMAAHAASTLDYHLAGYELTLVTHSGLNVRLRMLGGAPPVGELNLIEARAAGAGY